MMDEDVDYQEVLTKLNSLITGRRRPINGVWEWEHPLEAFIIYLQVLHNWLMELVFRVKIFLTYKH
jgi:hypothetical protein